MEYSYKFRIYPNNQQKEQIAKTLGCVRFAFNHYLSKRKTEYEENRKTLNYYDCANDLTNLKKELEWLKEVDSTALQSALRDLDTAYKNFFRRVKLGENPGYPKFKSKHAHRQSYKSKCIGTNIKILDKAIQLPKLGEVKCRISKNVEGRILSATVSKTSSNKYFVSLCCTDVVLPKFPETDNSVGIDVGIKDFAVLSDGTVFENHKYLSANLKKLAKLQRKLSRKTKGSIRYEKARIGIAKLHEHISNQRNDTLHKVSTEIVKTNDVICIEDLAPKNMLKNYRLAQAISDTAWGEFRRQLKYKAEWYGRKIIEIDRFYPSSQLCSVCGYKNEIVKNLSIRKWQCPECGTNHNRDQNAAINILNEGLRQLA